MHLAIFLVGGHRGTCGWSISGVTTEPSEHHLDWTFAACREMLRCHARAARQRRNVSTMDQNPYQSPQPDSEQVPGGAYYQTVSTRLTNSEYRGIAKNWLQLAVLVLLKTLRVPLRFNYAFAEHFQRVEPHEVSEFARAALKPTVGEALELGLQYEFAYIVPTTGTAEGAAAVLRSADGRSLLLIVYVRNWTAATQETQVASAFLSRRADGGILGTSDMRPQLIMPDKYQREHLTGRPLAEVWARHQQRVNESHRQVLSVQDQSDIERWLREFEQENVDFQTRRGIYRRIDATELERLQRLASQTEAPDFAVKRVLRWPEFVCWLAVGAGLLLIGKRGATPAQELFRFSLILAGLLGLVVIVLLRALWRSKVKS